MEIFNFKPIAAGIEFIIRIKYKIKAVSKILVDSNSYIWFRQSKTEPETFRIIVDSDKFEEAKRLIRKSMRLFNKIKEHENI